MSWMLAYKSPGSGDAIDAELKTALQSDFPHWQEMSMGRYVDGFILPVPKKNRTAYLKMARLGKKVWLEHGALEYQECVADDVKPGKHTSFPQAVKLKPGEEVWFSWAVYKSRKHRDQVMAKVMNDPRMASYGPKNMPFDGKRMFWGGFKAMVSAQRD